MAKSNLPLETPDRQLVRKIAEKASLDPLDLFEKILSTKTHPSLQTIIENQRFRRLFVDLQGQMEATRRLSFHRIEGLEIEFLSIIGGAFSDICLPPTTTLIGFLCNGSQLHSLGVAENPNLRLLDVTNNRTGFIDLSFNHELTWYKCAWNQLRYIDELPEKLETLICAVNKIRFADLSGAPGLKHLDCYTNDIEELDLSSVPELLSLNCGLNRIGSLDLRPAHKLRKLEVSEMYGSMAYPETPQFSLLPDLEYLNCSANNFREIDVSGNPNLRHLKATGNQVETVDFSKTPNLNELDCDWDLKKSDLSRLPNLKKLWMLECDLEVEGLSHTPRLELMSLIHCPIKSLDISILPNLRQLSLRDCEILEEIDLSSAPQLEEIEIWGSSCEEIDIRDLPNLKKLTVYDEGTRILRRADQEDLVSSDE